MTDEQKLREAAKIYANQFVAKPREELESWQEEKAQDFLAGAAHVTEELARERERSKLLRYALRKIQSGLTTDITKVEFYTKKEATEALKEYEYSTQGSREAGEKNG